MGEKEVSLKDVLKQMQRQQEQLQMQQNQQQQLIIKLLETIANNQSPSTETLFDRLYRRIDKFVFDADREDCFNLWYNRYKDVFDNECKDMEETTKTRLLVSLLDAASHAHFTRHILPKVPTDLKWDETIDILKTLFGTRKSLFRRRFECFKMNFLPNNDIDNFVNLLKARSLDANFKKIKSETLECLALIFAFQAPELAEYRVRFLRKLDEDDKTTVDDLIKEYHIWRSVKDDSKAVEAPVLPMIRAVNNRKKKKKILSSQMPPSPCPICSQQHWKRDCPRNRTSAATKESTTRNRKSHTRYQRRVNNHSGDVQKYLEVQINGHPTRLQLDTGADVTLISRSTWMQLGSPHLTKSKDTFKGANDLPMTIYGYFEANFAVKDVKGVTYPGKGVCYVTDDADLLGITWIDQIPDFHHVIKKFQIQKVNLLDNDALREKTIANLKTNFADVFKTGLGRCTKAKASLYLKPDARPIFIKKRPVPYASIPLLDAEIDRLLSQDVISPVDHSLWAAPIVVVKKANGTIRLCADFSTGLNDSLLLHQHPLPSAEDIFIRNQMVKQNVSSTPSNDR